MVSVVAVILALACGDDEPEVDACSQASIELFERRIEPVLLDEHPASCNQCHLSGVDLNLFVRSTPCETLACLIQDGLVDLERPEQSQVLTWIKRAKPESELITEQVIQAEYDAFFVWIEHAASCGACSGFECGQPAEGGFCDLDVEPAEAFDAANDPGDCSDKTLERLFLETVYVSRGRCYPCHFENAKKPPEGAIPWVVETDNCEASSLATLRNVQARGYVNTDEWQKSLLLTKPLAESDGGIEHGGHDKFTIGSEDPVYDNYIYWLERSVGCANAAQ